MKKNFSVDNCEGFAISFEGIPEVVNFSDDIFRRVAHIVKAPLVSSSVPPTMSNKTASSSRTQGSEV